LVPAAKVRVLPLPEISATVVPIPSSIGYSPPPAGTVSGFAVVAPEFDAKDEGGSTASSGVTEDLSGTGKMLAEAYMNCGL
jgi:hypothetical protein